MPTHSSVLAWRIPGTGEPGGLLSMGSHRIGHNWSDLAAAGLSQGLRSNRFKWRVPKLQCHTSWHSLPCPRYWQSEPLLCESLALHSLTWCLVSGVVSFCKRLFASNRLESDGGPGLCIKLLLLPRVSWQTRPSWSCAVSQWSMLLGMLCWGFLVLPHWKCVLTDDQTPPPA